MLDIAGQSARQNSLNFSKEPMGARGDGKQNSFKFGFFSSVF